MRAHRQTRGAAAWVAMPAPEKTQERGTWVALHMSDSETVGRLPYRARHDRRAVETFWRGLKPFFVTVLGRA